MFNARLLAPAAATEMTRARRTPLRTSAPLCFKAASTVNTVKKASHFPVPIRDVSYQTLPGREKLNYSQPGRV